jgi:RHS repeat-associated protein
VLQSGGQGAQASGYSDGASENGVALVDEEDSVSGLRSFRLETVGIGSISVVKRFSLPSRVPFGVSAGSFAIGVKPDDSQRRTGLRELLDGESRLDRRSGKLGKENDPITGPTSAVKNERSLPADSRSADTALDQGSGGSRKTMKTLSASPVGNYYLYSFDGKLLQTYNVYGVLLKDYIYMSDRLIAEYDHVGSRYLFYTPDQINSTRIVTDQTGNVVYSAAHDPYGGIQQTWVNTFDPTPKFSGKERDAESGLDYFGARYYDRSQYRFISVDPIITDDRALSDPQLSNMYAYCRSNPVVFIDKGGDYTFRCDRETKYRWLGELIGYDNEGHAQFMDTFGGLARTAPNISFYYNALGQISINVSFGLQINILRKGFPSGLTEKAYDRTFAHEIGHCEDMASYLLRVIQNVEEQLRTGKIKTLAKAEEIIKWKYDAAVARTNRIRHFPLKLFFGVLFQYEHFDFWGITITGDDQ